MKKRILSMLLCAVTFLSMLAPGAFAASSSELQTYSAYADYLQERLNQVGYLQPSTLPHSGGSLSPREEGVIYAALVDFDQDGIDELFTIESKWHQKKISDFLTLSGEDAFWHIYDFQNGKLTLIGSDQIILSSSADKFGIAVDGSGKPYYLQEFHTQSNFYSISGGALTKTVLQTSSRYNWSASGTVGGKHVWVHSNTSTITGGTIDGTSVSYDTYAKRMAYLTAGGFDCYGAVTDKMPDNTPYAVLNKLESGLTGYRTPSVWAKSTVNEAIAAGLVPAHLQSAYNTPITRAEFCELAALLYESISGETITERMKFSDTTNVSVEKMGALGIVTGVSTTGNRFSPDTQLTREAAATLLIRLYTKLGYAAPVSQPSFSDNSTISSWAYTQVGQAQALGIVTGLPNNLFAPQDSYTREQSIVTIMRIRALLSGN